MKKNLLYNGLTILMAIGLLLSLSGPYTTLAQTKVDSPENILADPIAVADNYTVGAGTTLTVDATHGVLANDSDADGDPLTAQLVGGGTAFGNLMLNSNGSFVYVPDVGYSGDDHFVYQAYDGVSTSSPVTVTITVTPGDNTTPVAVADIYNVESGTTLTVDVASGVLSNDYDADGDALTAQLVGGGTAFGSLTFNSDGSFMYTPDVGYIGADHFVYQATDGVFTSTPVTVTINVTATGYSAPVALADTYEVAAGTTLTVDVASGVLSNDYDADGDALTAQLVGGGTAFGSLTFNSDGSFVYTPDVGYIGADHFVYQATDGVFTSTPVTVTINVTATGYSVPVALADTYEVDHNTTLTVDVASGVLANDSDADGDALTAQLVGGGTAFGSLTFNSDGSFVYAPDVGYIGADHFIYQATDGVFTSTPVTVTINVTATGYSAPVALADTYEVAPGTTLTVDAALGVLANDSDADGDILTAQLVGRGTAFGTLTLNSDGSFVYEPNEGYTGTDRFVYQAYDGVFTSLAVTVTINVEIINIYLPIITG